jgi:hypothetical protein
MMRSQTPSAIGDTVDDVVEYYYRYLARNNDLAAHFAQFKKRQKSDPKAAAAEAAVFSFLRAEKLQPVLYEDVSTGGPDFQCSASTSDQFLVEVTSLDSDAVSERSGLPSSITGSGGRAFGLITDKLKAKAQQKASQLAGHSVPAILAVTSDHAFASILLDQLAAEYLMTSAPQINVPVGGGPTHMTTDLRHSVFQRATGILNASGLPIIKPALRSVAAILLIATDHREMRVVGLLHPDAANPFNPQWLPKVPFVRFSGLFSPTNIDTEWIQTDEGHKVASFQHRRIQ